MTTRNAGRWRPASFLNFHKQLVINPEAASRELDQTLQLADQKAQGIERQISAFKFGSQSVTGSLKGVVTGLKSVAQVVVSIDNGSTALNEWATATLSATSGAIDIYVWKPTAAGDTTPIASTTARTVRWFAQGETV